MENRNLLIIILVFIVIIIAGLSFFSNSSLPIQNQQDTNSRFLKKTQSAQNSEWMDFQLTDVNSGEAFKVSQFNKPVLLESFAVWCPTCTKQQKEIKKLHEEIGEDAVSVSLDTDPNEDANRVKEHTQNNGFDWYYAISPTELTQLLIDEFGTGIINAPSSPVVLICPDNSFVKLKSGVKDVSELKEALSLCDN